MAAVQISARIDGKIKDKASKVFDQYGLDIPGAIRAMLTITARTKKMPFVIGEPPVSLDGDSFQNDGAYFKQIPGYRESLVKASKEPVGEGKEYDPKTC
jgi:addiction module RelB/DinJ family antitoxin